MQNQPTPDPKIRLNSPILAVLTILLFALVILDGYRGWVILLIALGGSWLLAFIWASVLARGLEIRRERRLGWAQVGDRLEERFTLTNHSRLPAPWVEVVGQTNMPDYWANQVRSVKGETATRWQIRGICTRRGLYTLGPTIYKTSDPFGFYTVTLENPAATTLVVTPPVVPLPTVQVTPGGRAGEGLLRIKTLNDDINSAGVREYNPGESMRSIHWPTSARREALYVRHFERSPSSDWWVILDLDHDAQVGEGQNATQEHGIILAASLTDMGMHSGRSVGLAAYGRTLVWHPPRLSDDHKWDILRSLALVETGSVGLEELLELVRPSSDRKASLIIITAAVHGKWLPALMVLRRLGVVPTILLFDTVSFGGKQERSNLMDDLIRQGITVQMIPHGWLERSGSKPIPEEDWGWRDSAGGRLTPSTSRKEFSWRELKK